MIDKENLKELALKLREVLAKYSDDIYVQGYTHKLEPFLVMAERGEIEFPIDDIYSETWYYHKADGEFQKYPDLEDASANFVVALGGGIPPDIEKFLKEGTDA